jgi:hypothetical protein
MIGTEFMIEDVRAVWQTLEPNLARTRSDPGVFRRAMEKCLDGSAACIVNPDGVVIMTLEQSECRTIRAVVLLAMSTGVPGAFRRQEKTLVHIARELGAAEMAFKTDRRGWGKLLGPEWAKRDDSFIRSV